MIQYKKVTLKNFKSFGNAPTTFEFSPGELVRIRGVNGVGKSTIMEALFFCLYNKSLTGVNKNDLINSINGKKLEVSVEFIKGDKHYLIERGVKPNYLHLFIDGKEQEKSANVRDDQRIVEEVLEMNANTFRNTVVMSQSESKFFMEMTPAERREIVEELLNIRQFSVMSDILKSWISSTKALIQETTMKVGAQQTVVEAAKEQFQRMKALKESEDAKREARERELAVEMEEAVTKKDEAADTIKRVNEELEGLPDTETLVTAINETEETLVECNSEVSEVTSSIADQRVRLAEVRRDEAHVLERKTSLNRDLELAEVAMKEVQTKEAELRKQLKPCRDPDKITQYIEQLSSEIDVIRNDNIMQWEIKIVEAKRFEELIAEGKCPTCHRDACADDFEFTSVEECQKNLTAFEEKLKELREKHGELLEEKHDVLALGQELVMTESNVEAKVDSYAAAKEALRVFEEAAAKTESTTDIEADINLLETRLEEATAKKDKYFSRLTKLREMEQKYKDSGATLEIADNAVRQADGLIANINEKLEALKNEDGIDIAGEENRFKDEEKTLTALNTEMEEHEHDMAYFDLIKKILSDGGIKAHIVDIYIPFLNERINYYLVELDAYYDFNFTSTFDVEIKSRYRDKFQYESFSAGQRSRINIAIMLAFVDLAEAKATINTNLMFLDELLDSHLDDQGCDDILAVLRRKASDEQKAINIISHKSSIVEGFDREYTVTMDDNFTALRERRDFV